MKLPFFNELEKAQSVLIAGAGGGFDVFCGLPLYFALKREGKTVHLPQSFRWLCAKLLMLYRNQGWNTETSYAVASVMCPTS